MNGWDSQVWNGETWVGQFKDDETARAWIAGRPEFTLTTVGPTEKKRLAKEAAK